MSRSYRRPYASCCGVYTNSHTDKKLASRGVRRRQNVWVRDHYTQEDDFLLPHRLECSHNEVYSWGRDGSQYLQTPSRLQWADYMKFLNNGPFRSEWEEKWVREHCRVWPPDWYRQLCRK